MATEAFSSKWGVDTDDFTTQDIAPLVIGQFVATLILICIARPACLLTKRDAMRLPEFSWFRAVLVSLLIVAVTYMYPYCR